MTVTERELRRMELVDGGANRTELCEQLAMREYELDNLKKENAKLRNLVQRFSKFERNGCHECPMEEDCKVLCVYDGDCGMAVEIDEEIRELGIEANR